MTLKTSTSGAGLRHNLKYLYNTHNKNLRVIKYSQRYLKSTTIRRDFSTNSLKKNKQLTKNFYKSVYNIPTEIIAELPDNEDSNLANRKRPRYVLTVEGET